MRSEPRSARTPVWALPRSLAATKGIDVSFSSSGYLDVSVPRVPLHTLWIGVWITEVCSVGFPHSDISGSMDICSSPKLFAAYHVFHRLPVPRHPPCALLCLTIIMYIALYITGLGFLWSSHRNLFPCYSPGVTFKITTSDVFLLDISIVSFLMRFSRYIICFR